MFENANFEYAHISHHLIASTSQANQMLRGLATDTYDLTIEEARETMTTAADLIDMLTDTLRKLMESEMDRFDKLNDIVKKIPK